MLSIEKFKVALGPKKEEMTEEEILKLREEQDKMAEIFFNVWLSKINKDNI